MVEVRPPVKAGLLRVRICNQMPRPLDFWRSGSIIGLTALPNDAADERITCEDSPSGPLRSGQLTSDPAEMQAPSVGRHHIGRFASGQRRAADRKAFRPAQFLPRFALLGAHSGSRSETAAIRLQKRAGITMKEREERPRLQQAPHGTGYCLRRRWSNGSIALNSGGSHYPPAILRRAWLGAAAC